MITYKNKGSRPTFDFYCPVCHAEFQVTPPVCEEAKFTIERYPERWDVDYYIFSATMDCPECSANIRSKKIRIPVDKEKIKEYES